MINSQILREAKALIEDKDHWIQGKSVKYFNDTLHFCAVGALRRISDCTCGSSIRCRTHRASNLNPPLSSYHANRSLLYGAAIDLYEMDIVQVNDHLGHAAVMDVYDRAIKMAEMEEE